MTILTKIVNVKDFGAKGDYNRPQANPDVIGTGTDDSQAFKDAMQFIVNNSHRQSQWNDRGADYALYIPAGQYYIAQSDALISSSYTTPAMGGVRIFGDGRNITQLIYNPPGGAAALMNNNNGFNFMTVEDITFSSVGNINGLQNTFFKSFSNNQAQNFIFNRCNWDGGWKYLWHLVGVNTNSECTWFECGVYDGVVNALYIPPDSGSDNTVKGSDQMVNYNFFACQFEVGKGNYMRLDAGGNVNVWGGSIINTSGPGGGDGTTDNTFFKLGLASATTNDGTYRFLCQGVRFEMRGAATNKIIECNWPFGSVTFISCEMSVHEWVSGEGTHNVAIYDFKSNGGPNVQYIGCMIEGKHQYKWSNSNWQRRSRALYQGCMFANYANAEDFITLTNSDGASGLGSAPLIEFKNCQGNGATSQYKYVIDQVINWHISSMGATQKRILNVSNPDNTIPRSGWDFYLPLNCLILSVTLVVKPGATGLTTAGWHYTVKTSEGSPTTLADITPVSNNPSLGVNTIAPVSPPFFADTDAKRHLVCNSSGVNGDVHGFYIIEYIA